jgi:hypothetical protein
VTGQTDGSKSPSGAIATYEYHGSLEATIVNNSIAFDATGIDFQADPGPAASLVIANNAITDDGQGILFEDAPAYFSLRNDRAASSEILTTSGPATSSLGPARPRSTPATAGRSRPTS